MTIEPKDLHGTAATQEVHNGTQRVSRPVPRAVPSQVNAPSSPKKRGRVWRGLGVATLLLAAGAGAYFKYTPHGRDTYEAIKTVGTMGITMRKDPDLIFTQANSEHVNILLIGRDVNWKQGKVYDPKTKTYRPFQVHDDKELARSDTMIVVSLDKTRNTIRMISLPRDAIVHFPPNTFERRGKLNAAHAYGGPPLLIKTLHDELGIKIHHYAVIKFEGFKKLIDQVGGVEVKVDGALKRDRETGKLYRGNLDYDDNWGNLHIHLKPGTQRLNGEAAHNYVRFRMDLEGDTGRIRRQQDVMRALAKQIMQASPLAVPGLVKEFRRQFETDLTDEMLGSAAQFAKGLGNSAKIQPLTLFGVYNTRGSLTLNEPKNEKLLATVFGPTFNPDNFLKNSPTTEDDEIGITNDSNPAAQEVLREAGLLKDKKDLPLPREMTAPTRIEPSRDEPSARDSSTRRSRAERSRAERRSATSKRARSSQDGLAAPREASAAPSADLSVEQNAQPEASNSSPTTPDAASSSTSSSSASRASDTPRRSRRRRAASRESSSGSNVERRTQTLGGSPVPVPEANENALSVAESPIPQPEQ